MFSSQPGGALAAPAAVIESDEIENEGNDDGRVEMHLSLLTWYDTFTATQNRNARRNWSNQLVYTAEGLLRRKWILRHQDQIYRNDKEKSRERQ